MARNEVDDEFDDDDEFYDDDEAESLSGALAQQWGAAPWYVSSFGIHVVLFLVLLMFAKPPAPQKEKPITITTTITEPPPEPEEPPEPPKPIEEPEIKEVEIIIDPVVTAAVDVEVEVETEATEEPVEGDPSEFNELDTDVNSPALMGIGAKGGAGGRGGKFGSRTGRGKGRALRSGGGSGTQDALDLALKWLAAHQEADGHWNNEKYEGQGQHDVGITSLALLAFLGAGNSSQFGKYKDNVKRAQDWLIKQQNSTGFIGKWQGTKNTGPEDKAIQKKYTYDAAMALMAIAEAAGMDESNSKLQMAAQRAVDAACKHQLSDGGWESTASDKGSDVSVSGWYMMGLKSAKVAGLTIAKDTWPRAEVFFREMAVRSDNGSGEDPYEGLYNAHNGAGASPVCTAAVMCCLQFLGLPQNDPQIVGLADTLIGEAKINGERFLKGREAFLPTTHLGQSQDFYTWYYEALGFFQLGTRSRYWKEFNPRMKKELLTTQINTGTIQENRGSWDPALEPGGTKSWGRVGQTAVGALMLEVYYRYASVHKGK